MSEKVLITAALLYANGTIHFGHIAGAYLPADIYARHQRLKGNDVLYISGSDEYGVAITMSAEVAGRTPREHVDHFHAINKALFEKLNISFDHYSRTTWEGHVAPVQQYFQDLQANGFIEEKVTPQLYSEQDARFLADRYVKGTCPKCQYEQARGDECPSCGASFEATDLLEPRSKLTGAPLILKETKHWFLCLDRLKDQLEAFLEDKTWKPHVLNYVKSYVSELRPRSITRDSTWGVPLPLPNTEGKVFYVWFDAPIGYISATMEHLPDTWKQWWCDPNTKLVHFIGKDNIPFHGAIFPAMTLGQNQPYKLVDELSANEFYTLEGRQFSKSDGWFIDLDTFLQSYTVDQLRYFIAATAPETADSEFTFKEFQLRNNSELVGKFGNFINRTLVFAHKNCEGKVPPSTPEPEDTQFLEAISSLTAQIDIAYATFSPRKATRLLMELAQVGNIYFDTKQPWKDAKDREKHPRMHTTIACCLKCIQALANAAAPIIPETAEKILTYLNLPTLEAPLTPDHSLNPPSILFQKIEDAQTEKELQQLKATV